MKMRKLFSVSFVLALALTQTAPALAEDWEIPPLPEQEITEASLLPEISEEAPVPEPTPVDENEDFTQLEEPSALEEPQPINTDVIKVVVPAIGKIIVNPYGHSIATDTGETQEQIIHQAQPLSNYSEFSVVVNATAVGGTAPDSAAQFVTAPPSPDSQEKEIFMYAEFQTSADSWSEAYTDAPNQVVFTSEGSTKDAALTLDAQSEGYFRLSGVMTTNVDPAWSSDDALKVTLSYTFTKADAESETADPAETDSAVEPGETTGPEEVTEPEQPAETEDVAALEEPVELEEVTGPEEPMEPEEVTEPEEPVEPEDVTESEELVIQVDETTSPPGTPLPLYEDILPVENDM